ncbi:hypothetical protein [Streptomyces sp. NPDC058861]|uniref:hypothetical protein n=1 Tax=Streptomyces sp. NPDC058861 TaxID=3346653 RepID=UPI003681A4F8
MPTIVTLNVRRGTREVPAFSEKVDLDTLTPKARALAEAIHSSFGHQPLGVLIATSRTKGESPNFAYRYGTGPETAELAAEPDLRFQTHLTGLPSTAATTAEEWLEYNAREAMPYDAWPVAGAASRMEPLTKRVPSAEAAREDRCLRRDAAMRYLADQGEKAIVLGDGAWILLQKAGNLPAPRHYALGGRMPLWHVEDLNTYLDRDFERWTITQVAEHLGYQGRSVTGSARKQMYRWGLHPVGRSAGRDGENLYAADQVRAAHAARPGSGRHGASRTGGRFTTP